MNKDFLKEREYVSLYKIGQKVDIRLDGSVLTDCYIRTIIFSNSKIRYSVFIKNDKTTIHNLDSVFVITGYDEFTDFTEDNYS